MHMTEEFSEVPTYLRNEFNNLYTSTLYPYL